MPSKTRRAEVKAVGPRAKRQHGAKARKILVYPRKNGAFVTTRDMAGLKKGTRVSHRDYKRDKKIKAKTRLSPRNKLKYGQRGD